MTPAADRRAIPLYLLLTCRLLRRPLAGLGWLRGHTRYQALAYLIFGLGPLSRPVGIGFYFLLVATIGVIENCAATLVIWALWHVPIIVVAGYNAGTGAYGLAVICANRIPGEFGIAFTLVMLLLAAYFWKRPAEVGQLHVEAASARA